MTYNTKETQVVIRRPHVNTYTYFASRCCYELLDLLPPLLRVDLVYSAIVVVDVGSAFKRSLRFHVSNPRSSGEVATRKLISFSITQSTRAAWSCSSCHGVCDTSRFEPATLAASNGELHLRSSCTTLGKRPVWTLIR